jgi:hypothetical protein
VSSVILTPDWQAPAKVRAAFTLRSGGISAPPYESLNLGTRVGDAPEAVAENRRRVREQLRLPGEPAWLRQVHGVKVLDLTERQPCQVEATAALPTGVATADPPARVDAACLPLADAARLPEADAAVARRSGVVCAIQVADCLPVLFADRDGSVVGAAHAGWRGLSAGVLESTVHRLGAAASCLLAWLGPAIGPEHFEVGDEVRAAFLAQDPGAGMAFVTNPRGRWQCDLYELARRRLAALGIRNVSGGGWSTYGDAARFFSYRRDGVCGRMAALIWIEDGGA